MAESTQNNSSYTRLFEVCVQKKIPFATYRLPATSETVTMIQYASCPQNFNSFEQVQEKSGFVLAPFQSTSHQLYLLEPNQIVVNNDFDETLLAHLSACNLFLDSYLEEDASIPESTTFEEFKRSVEEAVVAIEQGVFKKVVLSKVRSEYLDKELDVSRVYQLLCEKYPDAFVFLIQLPVVGCWMGASPEPLLQISQDTVSTVSLAATQKSDGRKLLDYQWTNKEIEEQGLVTDFLTTTLRKLGVNSFQMEGPFNCQAASLIHLKTVFSFPLGNQYKLSTLVEELHPTPSVGGLPKQSACQFIQQNEKHNREYYTGYLGPINVNQKVSLFVNLRSVKLMSSSLVLFSGAGITASSDSSKEWLETENKLMTMWSVIKDFR